MEDAAGNSLTRAFDAMAEGYDSKYIDNPSMRLMRNRIWRHLSEIVKPGDTILELGCGTGEDALYLARAGCLVVATDCSPRMLRIARHKAAAAGLEDSIQFRLADINTLADAFDPSAEPFSGVLSNFGGLNTISHLEGVERSLLRILKPGGWFVACLMGRHCIWDWLIELAHLRFGDITGRRKNGTVVTVDGIDVRCYFPTPREFTACFPGFREVHSQALALFVPPPRVTSGHETLDWLWRSLERLEQPFARLKLFRGCGDHFLMVMEKV